MILKILFWGAVIVTWLLSCAWSYGRGWNEGWNDAVPGYRDPVEEHAERPNPL